MNCVTYGVQIVLLVGSEKLKFTEEFRWTVKYIWNSCRPPKTVYTIISGQPHINLLTLLTIKCKNISNKAHPFNGDKSRTIETLDIF